MRKLLSKCLIGFLSVLFVIGFMPESVAEDTQEESVNHELRHDSSTSSSYQDWLGATDFSGGVWTDKSVTTSKFSTTIKGTKPIEIEPQKNNFLVELSALSTGYSVAGEGGYIDAVFVLDLSSSMESKLEKDVTKCEAMVDAANAAIDSLLKANPYNRIGVVGYHGQSKVISELKTAQEHNQTQKQHLVYTQGKGNEESSVSGQHNMSLGKGTNIHMGITTGSNMLLEQGDTLVNVDGISYKRTPVLIVLSDGGANFSSANTEWWNASNEDTMNGRNSRYAPGNGFLAALTASYNKERIAEHYNVNKSYIYTIGVTIDELSQGSLSEPTFQRSLAQVTMNPKEYLDKEDVISKEFSKYWDSYIKKEDFKIVVKQDTSPLLNPTDYYEMSATKELNNILESPKTLKYNDGFWDSKDVLSLDTAFEQVVETIEQRALCYPTVIDSNDVNHEGDVTLVDTIGDYMEVKAVHGVINEDYYQNGHRFAACFINAIGGGLEEQEKVNEFTLSLSKKLKITKEEATSLITKNIEDKHIYYKEGASTNNHEFSNFLSWYVDADNNYLGYCPYPEMSHVLNQTTSGEEKVPEGAVKIIQDYNYMSDDFTCNLGDSTNMMYLNSQIETELTTGKQKVIFKVPAALLPIGVLKITKNAEGHIDLSKCSIKDTLPVKYLYEVGLRSDLNTYNITSVLESEENYVSQPQEEKDKYIDFKENVIQKDDEISYRFWEGEWYRDYKEDPNRLYGSYSKAAFKPSISNDFYYFSKDELIYEKYIEDGEESYRATQSFPTTKTRQASEYYLKDISYTYEAEENGALQSIKENENYVQIYPTDDISANNNYQSHPVLSSQIIERDGYYYVQEGAQKCGEVKNGNVVKTENITESDEIVNGNTWAPTSTKLSETSTFLGNNGVLSLQATKSKDVFLKDQLESIDNQPIQVGDQLTYSISFMNSTSETAEIVITDQLSEGLIYNESSAVVTIEGSKYENVDINFDKEKHQLVCSIEGVGANLEGTLTFDATVSSDALILDDKTIENTASVQAGNSPSYETNTTSNLVETTSVKIEGIKELTGREWTNQDQFEFEIMAANQVTEQAIIDDYVQISNPSVIVTKGDQTTAAIDFEFENLYFYKEGEYSFRVREIEPANKIGGITYSKQEYIIEVIVTLNDGILEATISSQSGGESVDKLYFENQYKATPASIQLDAQKILKGKKLLAEEFSFKLTPIDHEVLPVGGENIIQNTEDGQILFGTILFEEEGTYKYQITEEIDSSKSSINYDKSIYTVTYIVEDNLKGELIVNTTITKELEEISTKEENIVFENTFLPQPIHLVLDGQKTVLVEDENIGYELKGGEFEFEVIATEQTTPLPSSLITQNDENGNFVFEDITFVEPGQYQYVIKEKNDKGLPGITYDARAYNINVVVEQSEDGELKIVEKTITEGEKNVSQIVFENQYQSGLVSLTLSGQKYLEGNLSLEQGDYKFSIEALDDAPLPSSNEVTHDEYGNFIFGSVTFDESGHYSYKITENQGERTGVEYDATEIIVNVDVQEASDESNQLSCSYTTNLQDNQIEFVNEYNPLPSSLTRKPLVIGQKILIGRDIQPGEFLFEARDAKGDVVERVSCNELGYFEFNNISYNEEGQFVYTLYEINTGVEGIVYDETVYSIVVDVVDEDGQLVASAKYLDNGEEKPLTFRNEYHSKNVYVTLNAKKELKNQELKDKQFTFVLEDSNGEIVSTSYNDVSGRVQFDQLVFDKAGNYFYKIREINDEQKNIDYDNHVYMVRIEVKDNQQGFLETIIHTTEPMLFINKYSPPEVMTATKTNYSGFETISQNVGNRESVQTGDEARVAAYAGAIIMSLLFLLFAQKKER